jgi:hypothetical protein
MKKAIVAGLALGLMAGCSPMNEKFTEANKKELWAKVTQAAGEEERGLLANYVSKKRASGLSWPSYSNPEIREPDTDASEYMPVGITAKEIIALEKTEQASGKTVEKVQDAERKKRSLASAMLTLQLYLETYSVDWGGVYPANLDELFKEGNERDYFKGLSNPYTHTRWGYGNESGYGVVEMDGECRPGVVKYKPIKTEYAITRYEISGCEESGKLKKHGSDYILSNA